MTFSAKLTAAQRRWLAAITVVGVLLTAAALAAEWRPRGVYWSRITVRFLVPGSSDAPNVIKTTSSSMVRTAGAVARIVDPSGGKVHLADEDVTLASEGITHGTAVTLPNGGGQWTYSFAEPQLQIEAVGTTPEEVLQRMNTANARVHAALASLQPASEVATRNMIRLLQTPHGDPPIYFQAANRPRALAVTVLFGLLCTVVARSVFRVAVLRRGRRRRAASVERDHRELATAGAGSTSVESG